MKNLLLKRSIAFSIILSLFLSCFSVLTIIAADIGSITDDFSNSAYTSELWNVENVLDGTVLSDEMTVSGGVMTMPINTNAIATVNNTEWNKLLNTQNRKLEQVTYKFTPSAAGLRDTTSFVLYYDTETNDNVYILLSKHNTMGWQLSWGANGSSRLSNNFLFPGSKDFFMIAEPNLVLTATYKYADSTLSSIEVMLEFYEDDYATFRGVVKNTLTFTGVTGNNDVVTKGGISQSAISTIGTNFKVGFIGAANSANAESVKITEFRADFTKTSEEKATIFKNKYSEILSLEEANATYNDLAEVNEALNEYSMLDSDIQAYLTAQSEKLNKLGAAIIALKYGNTYNVQNPVFDDFENHTAQSFHDIWIDIPIDDGAKVNQPSAVKNGKLNAAVSDSAMATVVGGGLWPQRTLKSFTADVIVPDAARGTSYGQCILPYIDTTAGQWAGYEFTRRVGANDANGDSIQMRMLTSSNIARSSGGTNMQLYLSAGWDWNEPIKCKFTYVVVSGVSVTVNAEFSQGDVKYSPSFTYTPKANTSYTAMQEVGFHAGFKSVSNANGLCDFDNVAFGFNLIAEDYADNFRLLYKDGILSKTPDSITENEKEELIKALNEFAALPYDAQVLLTTEKALLNSMAFKLDSSASAYLSKYGDLLEMDISEIDHSYDELVDNALSEYDDLSELGKLIVSKAALVAFKEKLVNLLVPKGEDYSPETIDFEYNYFPFVDVGDHTDNSITQIVEDPYESGNHVMMMQVKMNEQLFFVVDPALWPEKGQMKTLSLKMRTDLPNAVAVPQIVYDFFDTENYQTVAMAGGNSDYYSRVRHQSIVSGEGGGSKYVSDFGLANFSEWIEFSFVFATTTVSCTVKFNGNGQTVVNNFTYTAGARFGFLISSQYSATSKPVYFDDINITFEKGDFDVNEDIEDINVYYSGNTIQKLGETLFLSGEQLGNIVEKVYISRVTGAAGDNPQYIDAANFETNHIGNAFVSTPTAPVFDSANQLELEITQRTKTSVKCILPDELQGSSDTGIYAVKIVSGKNGSSKILYINRPEINFISGDEGHVATAGGRFRIIGYNMVPTSNADDVRVVLKNSNSELFNLPVVKVYEKDNYYLEVNVPENFAEGKYEVFVHNSFGDNTCWSAPEVITIGKSPRDSWPKTVFNVKDFGAIGDADANDTPAFINALNAAHKNGGGIVYVPSGVYVLYGTLPVPQNVVIKGDGPGVSTMLWPAYKWQYGDTQNLLSIVGNCEINGVQLYSTRSAADVHTNKSVSNAVNGTTWDFGLKADDTPLNDNVYLENVICRNSWSEGHISQGGGGYQSTGEMTSAELLQVLYGECGGNTVKLRIGANSTNVQVKDLYCFNADFTGHTAINGTQVQLDGLELNMWSAVHGFEILVENVEMTAAFAVQGSKSYYSRSYMHDNYRNNRELFTTDGGSKVLDSKIQFIGDNPELMKKYTGSATTDEVTYYFVGAQHGTDSLVGYNYLVTAGQGMGQLRRITSNTKFDTVEGGKKVSYSTFTVEKPFTVSPNRNGLGHIVSPRNSMIFVNNQFYDGNAGAIYGAAINSVFDYYTFDTCAGPSLTNRQSIIWYATFNNFSCINNQGYVHGEGYGGTAGNYQTGNAAIRFYAQTAPCVYGQAGVIMKNSDLGAYRIHLTIGSINNSMWDLIIENNKIDGAVYAIIGGTGGINGMLIRENEFDVITEKLFDTDYMLQAIGGSETMNPQKSSKAIILIPGYESGILLGDVNGDGTVSLKDVSLIKYYICDAIEFDTEQLERGDVNEDGNVTNRDANQIRKYLIYGTSFNNGDYNQDTSENSSSESSSDDSSSDNSSSSTVSSDSSSSSTSSKDVFDGHW